MNRRGPGIVLSIFAILFALLALANFSKPFQADGPNTFVFLGAHLVGTPKMIIAPILGVVLAAYAIGILRMRRYTLLLSFAYFVYVALNLSLFAIRNPEQRHGLSWSYGLSYIAIAGGVSLASAMLLRRRRADLT